MGQENLVYITIYDNTTSLQAKIFIKKGKLLFHDGDLPKWMEEIINLIK